MPLLDHFHPPLSDRRHWEALHARWASGLADQLNREWLPERYFAEPQVHLGGLKQIDVATWKEGSPSNGHGVATATRTWTAPAATCTIPAVFPDIYEVKVIEDEGGLRVVAAIELISPGNKDSPDSRRAFVAKCSHYLQLGISLIIVDVVTSKHFNLHHDLMKYLAQATAARLEDDTILYAAAYRPLRRVQRSEIEIWPTPIEVGSPLPTLPLFPAPDLAIPVDLEAAYAESCERLRIS